jgi:hypothetical protein
MLRRSLRCKRRIEPPARPRGRGRHTATRLLDGRLIRLAREGTGQADVAIAVHLEDAVLGHWVRSWVTSTGAVAPADDDLHSEV